MRKRAYVTSPASATSTEELLLDASEEGMACNCSPYSITVVQRIRLRSGCATLRDATRRDANYLSAVKKEASCEPRPFCNTPAAVYICISLLKYPKYS